MTATGAVSATGDPPIVSVAVRARYGDQTARGALGDVVAVVPAADVDPLDRGVGRVSRTGQVRRDRRDRKPPATGRDEPALAVAAGAGVDDGDTVERLRCLDAV